MNILLLGALVLGSNLLALSVQERAARLEKAALLPELHWDLAEDSFVTSKDGWVAAVLEDGVALARHVDRGWEVRSPVGARVTDLRFRPKHDEIWFALGDGGVGVCRLDEGAESTPLDHEFSESVDQIVFSSGGSSFAWRCKKSETLHVVLSIGIAEEMRVREYWHESARFEHSSDFPFGGGQLPPFQFARGGRVLIFTNSAGERSATKQAGEGIGQVYDLQTETLLSSFRPYVCRRSRGWELSPNEEELLFARRDAMSDWSILTLSLTPPCGLRVLDGDARGNHFIDLFLDSTGRWLAESDREEKGVRLYDRSGESSAITIGTRRFLGFYEFQDGPHEGAHEESEPLILTHSGDGAGYSAWTVRGELAVKHVPALSGKSYSSLQSFGGGDFMGCMGWTSPEDSNRNDYHLDVLAIPKAE